MKDKKRRLWQLFITFTKIGGFTFGGGYAMIPLIQHETVQVRGWVQDEDITEIVAIAESTPGPIAINAATFVGYRTAGFLGAVCATLGVILPSFLIILGISYLMQGFWQTPVVAYAFRGLRAGVLALLVKALWGMYKKDPRNWVSYVIIAGAFVLTAIYKVAVLPVLIGCAVFGLIITGIMKRRADK